MCMISLQEAPRDEASVQFAFTLEVTVYNYITRACRNRQLE